MTAGLGCVFINSEMILVSSNIICCFLRSQVLHEEVSEREVLTLRHWLTPGFVGVNGYPSLFDFQLEKALVSEYGKLLLL